MNQGAWRRPILIVEDERKTSALLCLYFDKEGFKTIPAYDGQRALELARQHEPILIILDLLLPIVDGWEVCREFRRCSDIPILILTASGETHERIMGLTLGADDYVVKPFSPSELVARAKAILRRARRDPPPTRDVLAHRGLVMDLGKRTVTVHGQKLALTPAEYKLLHALMAAPGRVFLREELLHRLYPSGEMVIDRVIDVHIGKLRQKIEADPSKPRYVLTARGLGYHFADGDEQSGAPLGGDHEYQRVVRQPPHRDLPDHARRTLPDGDSNAGPNVRI